MSRMATNPPPESPALLLLLPTRLPGIGCCTGAGSDRANNAALGKPAANAPFAPTAVVAGAGGSPELFCLRLFLNQFDILNSSQKNEPAMRATAISSGWALVRKAASSSRFWAALNLNCLGFLETSEPPSEGSTAAVPGLAELAMLLAPSAASSSSLERFLVAPSSTGAAAAAAAAAGRIGGTETPMMDAIDDGPGAVPPGRED